MVAVTMGVMIEPASPEPASAMPMAKPRREMNQLERILGMGTPIKSPWNTPLTAAMM